MQNILLCVYLVPCIMRKSYETGKFYEFAKQKTKKNSILETTTLAKKKYIGNYYTNKVLSMSSTSISNKREKTTPINYLVYDFSKEQK